MKHIILAALVLGIAAGCAPPRPQELRVAVTENGFEPETLQVRRGVPATLIFTRKTDATCATSAHFAESGKDYDLPLNTDVRVELPTAGAATLHYACAMEMYQGTIEVK